MPPARRDGIMRRRGAALARVMHLGDEPALVRAWPVSGALRVRGGAGPEHAAASGVERVLSARNWDQALPRYPRRFRNDPLIGPVIRRHPSLRPPRLAVPFEALA